MANTSGPLSPAWTTRRVPSKYYGRVLVVAVNDAMGSLVSCGGVRFERGKHLLSRVSVVLNFKASSRVSLGCWLTYALVERAGKW